MISNNNPEINVEELMQRIRAEVAERKTASCKPGSHAAVEKPRFSAGVDKTSDEANPPFMFNLPEYSPFAVQSAFQPKSDGKYHVNDLICYHDQTFVDIAIRTVLCRPPDKDGNQHYLEMLRNGCAKVDILGRLRYSKEGRAAGIKISGLVLPFLLYQVCRIPVFGRFVQILSAIWHSPHLERNQRKLENDTNLLMEQTQSQLAQVGQAIRHFQEFMQDSMANQSFLDDALLSVKAQALDIKRNLLDQDRRLGLLLEEARKRLPEPISTGQIEAMLTEDDHRLDAMYASFEDRFRGTREDIKQRLGIYLPIVLEAKAGAKDATILDLGCGRGEWLELIHQEGLTAVGVDLNRIFLEGCRELGLDVVEQDAVVYMQNLKPNSICAVTAFHLIEHLPLKTLIALMDEILRVLHPRGVLILETPNPANVQVGSCNFYYDPTHRNPLPGQLTQYLLEARGFTRTHFMPLHPIGDTLDRLKEGESQLHRVFNQFFFGPQDYAVLGYKS
jgi:SAM-dependent methyltransferase